MTETWKSVEGYEGSYEVSDRGKVRSLPRTVTRSDGVVQFHAGRELSLKQNPSGRVIVQLSSHGKMTPFLVHRLVALAFLPNPENHPIVRHLNDVPNDNRVSNLAWGTYSENQIDRVRNGIYRNGRESRSHCIRGHELTPDNVYRSPGQPGTRNCRTCIRLRGRDRSRRQGGKDES